MCFLAAHALHQRHATEHDGPGHHADKRIEQVRREHLPHRPAGPCRRLRGRVLDVGRGGFELTGGRNVVSRGGLVKPSKRHFPVMVDKPNQNRCLKVSGHSSKQAPRTVHIEGLHCAGEHIWEGINVDSKGERGNLTVQLRNILIDRVNVEYPGGTGKHIGGDALQVWNGPHRLLIDGFTAKNLEYQGMFLQPYQFGTGSLGTWDLRNINLEGDLASTSACAFSASNAECPDAGLTTSSDFGHALCSSQALRIGQTTS